MKYNTFNVSGAGRVKVSQAEKSLEEYRFLHWYTAFIRRKKSKSNLMMESQRQAQPSQLESGCAEAEEEIDNSENEITFHSIGSESEDTICPKDIEKVVSEERLIFYTIKLQDTATILPVSDAFFIYIFTKLHYHERFRHNFWPSSGISKLVK